MDKVSQLIAKKFEMSGELDIRNLESGGFLESKETKISVNGKIIYPSRAKIIYSLNTGKYVRKLKFLDGDKNNILFENMVDDSPECIELEDSGICFKVEEGCEINQELLLKLFHFDFEDGKVYIKTRCVGSKNFVGDRVGSVNKSNGYRIIKIGKTGYKEHRLMYLAYHGEIDSTLQIDHIDRKKVNNSIENLRMVDNSGNQRNLGLQKNNRSGYLGVHKTANGRYVVVRCKKNYGTFKNIEDAISKSKEVSELLGFTVDMT